MKKQLQTILQAALAENKADLLRHEKVKTVLAGFEGKILDGRTQKKILAALGPNAKFEYMAGMFSIILDENGRKTSHLVQYASNNGGISVAAFEKQDTPYSTGAKKRIEQIEALLQPERFAVMVKTYQTLEKTWNAFKEAANAIESNGFDSYPNPVYYELLRLCGLGSRLMQNIKYKQNPE